MQKIKLDQSRIILEDEIIGFIEKRVTKFGNGAKVDCPKKFLGKHVYIVVCRE